MSFRVARTANAAAAIACSVMGGGSWALWLAAPAVVTSCAALASYWHGRRETRRRRRPDTTEAMLAHRTYLETLSTPPRGTRRVGS